MAQHVSLNISINKDVVCFIIKDNGVGFVENNSKPNALGLINVKERVERLSGKLLIENAGGTKITVKIPLASVTEGNN